MMTRHGIIAGVLACACASSESLPPASSLGFDGDTAPMGTSDDEGGESSGSAESTGELAEDHGDEIDAFVLGLGHLAIPPEQPEQQVDCDPQAQLCPPPWQDGELSCHYVYTEQTDHAVGVIALQPDSASLWPGAVVRGDEALAGDLVEIGVERGPLVFSLSLENAVADPSAQLDVPSLSAFRTARNAILQGGLTGSVPANIAYRTLAISSESQLEFEVKAGVGWTGGAKLQGLFSFDESSFSNRFLVDFTQSYYTVDMDVPSRPAEMFAQGTSVDDLSPHMDADSPPMYVQSIVYGRRVLFGIETNASFETIAAAIGLALNDQLDLDIGLEAKAALSASKVTALLLGGNGGDAAVAVAGPAAMVDYLDNGGEFSADSPGAPISYRLAYLDNVPAKFAFRAEYATVVCEPI
jgi:thiol-activated cytolysin